MIVLCVLKSGGDFEPAHVARLRDNLAEHSRATLVCLSDVAVPCDRIPLVNGWPGWWSKIEIFRVSFGEPVLYVDLDVAFVDDPAPLFRERFTAAKDAHFLGSINSSVMSWGCDLSDIYGRFSHDPVRVMREYSIRQKWGDQSFITDTLDCQPEFFADTDCVSYKAHCTNNLRKPFALPNNDVRVVYFHGKPRPWDVPKLVKHGR